MEGEHQHEQAPPVVAPVIDTGNELVQPVVDHTEKITRIEERQARHEEELLRQIGELESRVTNSSKEEAERLYTRINELEAKLEASVAKPVEEVPEAVEFAVPDVEASPAPPEKVRQGLRHRRKAKRGKK